MMDRKNIKRCTSINIHRSHSINSIKSINFNTTSRSKPLLRRVRSSSDIDDDDDVISFSLISPTSSSNNLASTVASSTSTSSASASSTSASSSPSSSQSSSSLSLYNDDSIQLIHDVLFNKYNNQHSDRERVSKFWDDDDDDDDDDEDDNEKSDIDDDYSLPSVNKVDSIWFNTIINDNNNTSTTSTNSSVNSNNTSTTTSTTTNNTTTSNYINDLIIRYFNLPMLRTMIYDLAYEDHRFTSSRLSTIIALYRYGTISSTTTSSNSDIRMKILQVLLESTYFRVMRNKEASVLNNVYEIEVHHNNYKWLGAGVGIGVLLSISSRYDDTKKNKITIRDHDWCHLELIDYIICSEFHDIIGSSSNSSTKDNYYEIIIDILVNCLNCYGSHLGNNSETLEQPALIGSIIKMYNKLLHIIVITSSSSSVSVLLSKLLRHWPKSNYVKETGFIRVLECVLLALSKSPIACMNIVKKAIIKVINGVSSKHFKICLQCIATLKNSLILERYLLSSDNDEQDILVLLVDKLRVNREHINPLVREQSKLLLDILHTHLE